MASPLHALEVHLHLLLRIHEPPDSCPRKSPRKRTHLWSQRNAVPTLWHADPLGLRGRGLEAL